MVIRLLIPPPEEVGGGSLRDHRFPRSARICRKGDFQLIFDQGVRMSTRHLRGVIHEVGRDRSRLGLAVSRKVGNAVVRNLLKRRLREIFRTQSHLAPNTRDLILIARPGCADLDFESLKLEVVDLISRRLISDHDETGSRGDR